MAAGNTTERLQDSAECWSCPSLSGERRISPGPFIHDGRYWMVDHAYPTRLPGWLVLVLKRHAEEGLFTEERNRAHIERVDLSNYDLVARSRPRAS